MLKGGFLDDPSKPGTAGRRNLMYDRQTGMFDLYTESYARINCEMEFGLYPFDTQECKFVIDLYKNSSYEELTG